MTSQRYFAIIAAMRTGSNLLEKTFEALGDTDCYGEAFNPAFISHPRAGDVLGCDLQARDSDPLGFLERMIACRPDRIAGFRIFRDHNERVLDFVLSDPRCTKIVLTRDPLESWVSLQIAQKTGQWMLRDPRRRRTAKIRFDGSAFDRFAACQRENLEWVEDRLAWYGKIAIRLDYRDLPERTRLQEAARAIGSSGTVPRDPPILRQNPERFCEKVENHAEMCAYLGMPPPMATCAAPPAAPRILRPEGFAAGYAPIPGPALAPAIALMHRIEVRDFGRESLPLPELLARTETGTRHPPPQKDSPAFTVACHPLIRAHAAFVHECFGPGWRASALRDELVARYGPMPTRKALAHQTDAYPADLHRTHFSAFLDRLADAKTGNGRYPMIPDWVPQAELLDRHACGHQSIESFRHEDFCGAARWLTDRMDLPPLPPGQIAGIRKTGQQSLLSPDGIATPEIEAKVRNLYAADFDRFGYAEYSTGNSGASNGAPSA